MTALNVPTWNQLNDPGPGGPDPQAEYDCGEECVSMVLSACTGAYTTEGQIRMGIPGHQTDGRTVPQALADYLSTHACPASVAYPGAQDMLNVVRYRVQQGFPTLVLGHFLDQYPNNLHWVVVVDANANQIGYNDPWGGERLYQSAGWFAARYNGGIVQVSLPVKGHGPRPSPVPHPHGTYTVKAGDTLGQIAAAHGVSMAVLERANPSLTNPNAIRVGEVINIP